MLFINRFLLCVNLALLINNIYLHKLGWAAVAAGCMLLNLSAIRAIEERL